MNNDADLNDFDMVLAIAQDTINREFMYTPENGRSVTLLLGGSASFNGTLADPIIQLVPPSTPPSQQPGHSAHPFDPRMPVLTLGFSSATITFRGQAGAADASADASNVTFSYQARIRCVQVSTADLSSFRLSDQAQTSLTDALQDRSKAVYAVALSTEDLKLVSIGGQMSQEGAAQEHENNALNDVGMRLLPRRCFYTLGVQVLDAPLVPPPFSVGFGPTGLQYAISPYVDAPGGPAVDDSGLDTLCFLNTAGGALSPPSDLPASSFTWNLVPAPGPSDAEAQGMLYISSETFASRYIETVLLPALGGALGSGVGANPSGAGWAVAPNMWTLNDSQTDSDQNDGHGPVLSSGALDVYGASTNWISCTLNGPVAQPGGQVCFSGNGFFFKQVDFYERPFDDWTHVSWVKCSTNFTLTVTLSAGTDGTIDVAVSSSAGDTSKDHWENDGMKITDDFAKFFTKTLDDRLSDVSDRFAALQSASFTDFQIKTAAIFNDAPAAVVLPSAKRFYYKNLALTPRGALKLEVTYKD